MEQDLIIERFNEFGVKKLPNAKLRDGGGLTSTLTGAPMEAPFDALVLVGARAPVLDLFEAASAAPNLPPMIRIGDCNAPGTIQAAVLSGHMHARHLLGRMRDARDFNREFVEAGALRV